MKIIFAFVACFSLLFANALSFNANQTEIELAKNQCAFNIVDFDENPSTGYMWSVVYDDKIFTEPQKEFLLTPTTKQVVGSGGKTSFSFKIKPKYCNDANLTSSKLIFKLERAWESVPAKTKNINIKFNF